MSNLQVLNVNSETIYKVIKDNIYSCATKPITVGDNKFHHELRIDSVPKALEHGLLSKIMQLKLIEKRELTEEERFIFSDDFHVNGLDSISLSSVDEDLSKMYRNEDLWPTYSGYNPDIIISSKVDAKKNTINYFNEYLVKDEIPVSMFNSIDVRILKSFDDKFKTKEEKIRELLSYYEYIRKIAILIKDKGLNIPYRETSLVSNKDDYDKAITLDIEKVIKLPKLTLK